MREVQNTSHAVMAQRFEPSDSLDDFPTPPWATRALVENVLWGHLPHRFSEMAVWEPSCNRGHMVRPLREYFGHVYASDIHDYRWSGQQRVSDFLAPGSEPPIIASKGVDWLVFNPPFRLAEQFVMCARGFARQGVAVFARTQFLEGAARYDRLFSKAPPTVVAQFTERVILSKGILRDPSKKYWDEKAGKWKRPSTATAYCWLVWITGDPPGRPTEFQWIQPCRKHLERPEDYEAVQ